VATGVTYLLDTNAISDLMRAVPRIEHWYRNRLICSSALRAGHARPLHRTVVGARHASPVAPCAPRGGGRNHSVVKLARQQRGLALDENDLWVAATALALGATLVSRDRDFAGIDGLPVLALE
jgi:predicted nucleic acid-binding protein